MEENTGDRVMEKLEELEVHIDRLLNKVKMLGAEKNGKELTHSPDDRDLSS